MQEKQLTAIELLAIASERIEKGIISPFHASADVGEFLGK